MAIRRRAPGAATAACLRRRTCCVMTPVASASPVVLSASRGIHQALPPPPQPSRAARTEQRMEAAKAALLQLNVMVDQGIEPDVFMYTDLISVMGAAKLEWQAFKLFSRMLARGIRPLPETYLALQRATDPSRHTVIADLQRRMEEAALELPGHLAKAETNRISVLDEEGDRAFDALLSESATAPDPFALDEDGDTSAIVVDDPYRESAAAASASASAAADPEPSASKSSGFFDDSSIPTMEVTTPRGVLRALDAIESDRAADGWKAENLKRRAELLEMLAPFHEEELRIVLTIHRQLRDGSRDELAARVVANVPAAKIEAMVRRRKRFFAAAASELAGHIQELEQRAGDIDAASGRTAAGDTDTTIGNANPARRGDELQKGAGTGEVATSPPADGDLAPAESANDDITLLEQNGKIAGADTTQEVTPADRLQLSPVSIRMPWGGFRKRPEFGVSMGETRGKATLNPRRTEAMQLSDDETAELFIAARSGAIADVPLETLRRYCRVHRVSWRRSQGPTAMANAVQWHLETFPPIAALQRARDAGGPVSAALAEAGIEPSAMPARQRGEDVKRRLIAHEAEVERKAATHADDMFTALKVIAQRCGNARIVDDAEISRAARRVYRREKLASRRRDEAQRRADANARRKALEATLQSMPSTYDASPVDADEGARTAKLPDSKKPRVLGVSDAGALPEPEKQLPSAEMDEDDDDDAGPNAAPAADDAARELPPWAVRQGSSDFNFTTGRFGNPDRAQIKERADGTFGLDFGAQRQGQFKVDVDALPPAQRDEVRNKLLAEENWLSSREATSLRQRVNERATSHRGAKFLAFVERARKKKEIEKEIRRREEGSPAQSIRMAQKLRVGQDSVIARRRPVVPEDE